MACGVRGAPLWSVVACGCGVRRRAAAAKTSARQGQRGHEPGRLLSLAAILKVMLPMFIFGNIHLKKKLLKKEKYF